jgi:hypothetical protein
VPVGGVADSDGGAAADGPEFAALAGDSEVGHGGEFVREASRVGDGVLGEVAQLVRCRAMGGLVGEQEFAE